MPIYHEDIGVLSWATNVEDGVLEQAAKTAQLPFVLKPLALMPDAHVGIGATVGSVIATKGAIVPAAVGVDIGCGMVAAMTTLSSWDLPDDLTELHNKISRCIPAGVGRGHENHSVDALQLVPTSNFTEFSAKQKSTLRSQFGSLGSGNHFVEICLDEHDRVWLVLHSGSRGIGNQLATMHIAKAKRLMQDWFIELPDPNLAYLPAGTVEYHHYIADLLWAQEYALQNRAQMMRTLEEAVAAFVGFEHLTPFVKQRINCHHNFTQPEIHHGQRVMVTRKGAISAKIGELGIIPGSMGTRSYIVEGQGNAASYMSCSHGAGRRMSRTQARVAFSVSDLTKAMEGIAWNNHDAALLLDEHVGAYKDIDEVMDNQIDLVRPLHTLHQILNYKGTR